jgi:pimeloyl-ACP methyl ester carboxylesterase
MSAAPPRVSDDVLDDLRRRLRDTRRVPLPDGMGWDRGTDPGYLAELVRWWAESYDWRAHEDRIRSWPWVQTEAARVIHQRAEDDDAPVVVLLHGWPDSVLRFERVLPLLADVHVVVPALPGYPFSDPATGMSSGAMADSVAEAVAELGYVRYVVSGGDIGSSVGESLANEHPDRVAALHLTDVPYTHLFTIDADDLTDAEQAYLAAGREWQMTEGSYAMQQATKPHTLAAALGDSPAGTAAWIVEKLRSWTDSHGDVESAFRRDELLTWVTAYWVTGTIGTSFSPYVERKPPVDHVGVPTTVTIFPHDLVLAPREFAERFFDIKAWDERPEGGHFGAWERPEAFVAGVRSAIDAAQG